MPIMNPSHTAKNKLRPASVLLAISLMLNAGAMVAGLLLHGPRLVPPAADPAPAVVAPMAARNDQPKPDLRSAEPKPFQWSSLESEDYSAFISRLRQIGCPETTILDIIRGELLANAADRRKELETTIMRSTSWRPPSGVTRRDYLASQLRKLDKDIADNANLLMRNAPSEGRERGAAETDPGSAAPPVRYPAIMAGLKFKPVSDGNGQSPGSPTGGTGPRYAEPGVVQATPEQIASIQEMQSQFVKDIGGPNQDPADPAYEKKWRDAQWLADQIFRARYGYAAFNDLVRAASIKAYEDGLAQAAKEIKN